MCSWGKWRWKSSRIMIFMDINHNKVNKGLPVIKCVLAQMDDPDMLNSLILTLKKFVFESSSKLYSRRIFYLLPIHGMEIEYDDMIYQLLLLPNHHRHQNTGTIITFVFRVLKLRVQTQYNHHRNKVLFKQDRFAFAVVFTFCEINFLSCIFDREYI